MNDEPMIDDITVAPREWRLAAAALLVTVSFGLLVGFACGWMAARDLPNAYAVQAHTEGARTR